MRRLPNAFNLFLQHLKVGRFIFPVQHGLYGSDGKWRHDAKEGNSALFIGALILRLSVHPNRTAMTTCLRLLQQRIFCLLLLLPLSLFSQPPTISYEVRASGFSAPVDVVHAGDGSGRLFIVEQGGVIKVLSGTTVTTFANLGAGGANLISTGGEQGLLSMAFHPDFDDVANRFFYVYYTDLASNIAITRFQTTVGNSATADLSTALPIITIAHPGQTNHNGGKLAFGADGYLYFATGDGGGGNDPANNAQNGASLLGKMIRIDVDGPSAFGNYSVPPDNPYLSDGAVDDRIWAIGLRNPFRWSFDRANGAMWIGDVGQGAREEVHFRAGGSTGGVNYGWRCFEGHISTPGVPDCVPPNYVPPVYDYDNPASGSSAVTGGYVYRGSEYATFRGYYISADVYSGDVHLLWPNSSGGFDSSVQSGLQNFVVGFGEGEDGTLYAVSQGTGTLYKVAAAGGVALPVVLTRFAARAFPNFTELQWTTAHESGTARFGIQYRSGSGSFQTITNVPAARSSSGSSYTYRHSNAPPTLAYYRLAIEDDDGKVQYSPVVSVSAKAGSAKIYPTIVRAYKLTVELPGPARKLQVVA